MKNRIVKRLSAISLALILFLSLPYILNFLYFGGAFIPPPNKEQIEKNFIKNRSLLVIVADYMENVGYNKIYINDKDKKGFMQAGGEVPIENEKTSNAIHTLLWKRNYNIIKKYYNTISFEKWAGIQDISRGIAYSIDGKEPIIEFLTELEPLSEEGWYYYEADYEKWRVETNSIPHYILGVWNIQSAQNRNTKENYPLQDLYGAGIEQGGTLTFNTDFTFSRYLGITTGEVNNYEGTYSLSYDNKIILKYNDGTTSTIEYLPSSQEIVYYTWDKDQIAIDEYYIKLQ